MASHSSAVRVTPGIVANACKETTLRLHEWVQSQGLQPNSLVIVFSGSAGAILWGYALKRGCASTDTRLNKYIGDHLEFRFIDSAQRSLPAVPIHAVICGAKNEQRIPVLGQLFHAFDELEYSASPKTPLAIKANVDSEHHNFVNVLCSVSFHDQNRPVLPATRLRVERTGQVSFGMMRVATANPTQLLFEAFKDIMAQHPEDYNLAEDKPLALPSLETVMLLYRVIEAVLEHGSSSVRIGFPCSRNPPDVVVDNLERIVQTNAEYNDVEKWLLNVDTALTRELEHSHDQGKVLHRQYAFHYLKKFFDRFYNFQPKLVDLTQAEDTFDFPSWPISPHDASSRR